MHGRQVARPSGFGAPGRQGGSRRQVECSRDGREDRSAFAAPPCARSPLLAGSGTSAKISLRRLAPASGLYGYMLAARRCPPSTATVRCVPSSYKQRAPN